ncbi:MAG: sugar transferase [Chloroflexi bacterium]|nr:sugar transferase [Chloroflexota bacterium]MDL1886019.1 sugar transferase [Anaerolineae bacterium CFX8]GIL14357.1 MAG: UDP-phosphate galactose phosphotransferase [Chloroflexota bacterium]
MANELIPPRRSLYMPKGFWPLVDVALVFVAFAAAHYMRYELQLIRAVDGANRAPFGPYLPYAAVYAALLVLNYQGSGLYRSIRGRSWMEEVYGVVNGVTNATVIVLGLYFVFQPLVFSRLMLVYVAALTVIALALVRAFRRLVQAHLRTKGIGIQRVLVVGAGDVGKAVLRTMIARRELGYRPVGYVDDDPERASIDLGRVKGLGGLKNLGKTIRNHAVDLVVITLPWAQHDRILELVEVSKRAGAEVRVVPDVFQLNLRQVHVESLDGIPLLGVSSGAQFSNRGHLVKRALDIGLIALASPLLIVIFGLIALAIRLEGPGPIFYKQRRVGRYGQVFDMVKFRSMVPNADALRAQLIEEYQQDPRHPKFKNDPRVTRVGRLIRTTSLDELPNLFNVLRGQMSLVGPRPPTPDEVAHYEPWHMQRLQILPGMTGLWQVNGRSDVPFDEMCLLDIYYIENWSVKLDAQILMLTLPRVLLGHGAY